MLGWIGMSAAGRWRILFWALAGLLSLPASAWAKTDAVRAAGKKGVSSSARARIDRDGAAQKARGTAVKTADASESVEGKKSGTESVAGKKSENKKIAVKESKEKRKQLARAEAATKKNARKTAKMTKRSVASVSAGLLPAAAAIPAKEAGKIAMPDPSRSTRGDAVRTAVKSGMKPDPRARMNPERLAQSDMNMNPFAEDYNPKKDPINRAATRMVRMPMNKAESVHLNVMGQVLKLSFKIKSKASREGDAGMLMRYLHSADSRGGAPAL